MLLSFFTSNKIISFFWFSILALHLSSCAEKPDNSSFLKVVNNSIEKSNTIISGESYSALMLLKQESQDPAFATSASIEKAKLELLKKLTDSLIKFIDAIKQNLKAEMSKKNYTVFDYFCENKNAEKLYVEMINYKESVFKIDSLYKNYFQENFILVSTEYDKLPYKHDFSAFFKNLDTAEAIILLNTFQNNIYSDENLIARFCLNHVARDVDVFCAEVPLLTQDKSFVKASETITVTAGVGCFNVKGRPVINIAGKDVSLNSDGYAVYHFVASKTKGKHSLPLHINYFNQNNGKRENVDFKIQYTVIE